MSFVQVSAHPPFVSFEDGFHIGEQVRLRELLVGSLVGPDRLEAQFVAILEPGGDLLDGGLLQVVGEGGLAGAGRCAGENVAAGVGDSAS